MSRYEVMSDYAVQCEKAFIKRVDNLMNGIMNDIDYDSEADHIHPDDGHLILLGVADHLEEIIKAIRG